MYYYAFCIIRSVPPVPVAETLSNLRFSYYPNHPSTLSSQPDLYWNGHNGHNYGDDANSPYCNSLSPYPGSSHPLPLVPTNNISTFQELLRQTPPGHLNGSSYPTHHPASGDIDPSLLTYNMADDSSVLPGVSQASAVGEIAPNLHIPLQQQLLDPIKPDSAPFRGKLTDHEPIKSAEPNQCLQCLHCFHTMAQLNRHSKDSKHAAFKCKCEATFGRSADLGRHLAPYRSTDPAFPCTLCTRRSGKDGFWRKDHLIQHIRTYHRVTSENFMSVEDRQQ